MSECLIISDHRTMLFCSTQGSRCNASLALLITLAVRKLFLQLLIGSHLGVSLADTLAHLRVHNLNMRGAPIYGRVSLHLLRAQGSFAQAAPLIIFDDAGLLSTRALW